MTTSKPKAPCPDCNDTGVLRVAGLDRTTPCYCGATGEKRVANSTRPAVESAGAPRFFRGAKIR